MRAFSAVYEKPETPLPDVVVFYVPRAVDSPSRSHTVEQRSLASFVRQGSYRIPEADIEAWLSLRQPGELYQTFPPNKYGSELCFNPYFDDDEGSNFYRLPQTGGKFEVVEPAEDLLVGAYGTPPPPTSEKPGGRKRRDGCLLEMGA